MLTSKMQRANQASTKLVGTPRDATARLRGASNSLLILAVYFLDDAFLGVVAEGSSMPRWLSGLLVLGTCVGAAALFYRARRVEATVSEAVAVRKQQQAFRVAPREDNQRANLYARLAAAGKQGDRGAAEAVHTELASAGYRPDTCAYNNVIQACTRSKEPWLAKQWFRRMEEASVAPDEFTYSILMDCTCKAGDAERTEEWYRRMCQRGVTPNKACYAALVHARGVNGELEAAEAWVAVMLKARVTPNLSCVSSLIHAYSRRGDVQSAERWFDKSTAWGITPNVTTLTSLIDASAKCGDPSRACRWLERMLDAGLEPNVVTYTAVIDAYAKAEDAAGAGRWYRRMLEMGVEPNAHTYGAVTNAYAKVGDVEAAEGMIEEMQQRGRAPNLVAFCGVIDACVRKDDVERGLRTFRRLRECGLEPNVVAYASLARLFSKHGDWAKCEALAEEMKRDGVRMNEYFLYTLLLSYGKVQPRQCKRAEATFRVAFAGGLKANDHVQEALRRVLGVKRCQVVIEEVTGEEMTPPVPRGAPTGRRAHANHASRD